MKRPVYSFHIYIVSINFIHFYLGTNLMITSTINLKFLVSKAYLFTYFLI